MKILKTIILLLILVSTLSSSYSLDVITKDDYETIEVIFNDEKLDSSASAKLVDGNLMLPMRNYFEILGASIKWVANTREVISYKNNTFIKIKIDSETAFKNGKEFELGSKPMIIGSSTYIPARFISDTFGLKSNYKDSDKTLKLDFVENSIKFNFIKNDYFKRIPFDDLGVYLSIPQLWKKSDDSNTRYEYLENDISYSLDVSSATLKEDQTIEDFINEIKKSEFEIHSTDITYTGTYEDTINGIDAVVLSNIIKNTTKEIRFFLKEGKNIYTLRFNYSLNAQEGDTIDTINLIAKSFQISNFTINYDDEHYIEYDALHNNKITFDQNIYSNKEIKGVMPFSGSVSENSLIDKLKVSVSRLGKTKVFIVDIIDGQFDGNIYAPYGLGKHNVLIESIWKTESEITKSAIDENTQVKSTTSQMTLNKMLAINENSKKLTTLNPKILEFSVINLEIDKLEYLVPSEKIQKDHVQITSLSNLLTYEKLRKFDKAKAIFDWTTTNIELKQSSTFDQPKNSVSVFDDEYGNSLEINILYTSLLRSIDIPSRIILASNEPGTSYYYTEIYINGEWSASDPVAAIRFMNSESSSDAKRYFILELDAFKKNFDKLEILSY